MGGTGGKAAWDVGTQSDYIGHAEALPGGIAGIKLRNMSDNNPAEPGGPAVPKKPSKRIYQRYINSTHPHRVGSLQATQEREAAWNEMIKLRIRGATLRDCAEILGYYQGTIERWNKMPEFQAKLAATRAQIFGKSASNRIERIQQKAREKVNRVEELIDRYSVDAIRVINVKMRRSQDEHIQLKAAIDLAERGSKTAKTKKMQQQNLHAIITPEMLASMAKTASEICDFGHPIEPVELDESVIEQIEHDDESV
jgi:hypothetical protein